MMLRWILDNLFPWMKADAKPEGRRSGQWPRVRKEHLDKHPTCAACGGKEDVEVHHVKPFHLFPYLELAPENLITLCERKGCHLLFGHLGNFKSWNEAVREWANRFRAAVENRP